MWVGQGKKFPFGFHNQGSRTGVCFFMFLVFNCCVFQVTFFNNVNSIRDFLKGIDVGCEKKNVLCFKKELHDINTIKEMRLLAIKLRMENRINIFSVKFNSLAKSKLLGKNACPEIEFQVETRQKIILTSILNSFEVFVSRREHGILP